MREAASILGLILVAIATVFVVSFLSFKGYEYFAPKYEEVRRNTMVNSRQYDEATLRELYRLKRQYDEAKTDEERNTVALSARHEFEIFPEDKLPPKLYTWMQEIR
jgi:hypothetical protein